MREKAYLRRNFFSMNLHEYQAKEVLKKYNVPVQEGYACTSVQEAEEAYRQIKTQTGSKFAVVKAQIHAGGRGKGAVKENGMNGVKVAKSLEDVQEITGKLLGGTLVTVQTGPAGKIVNKVLVAQDMYYDGPSERKEFYLSILLDRSKGQNVIMYSTEGGMNIEDVAHDTPEKIFREWVHPSGGLQAFQARKIAFNLGLSGEAFKNCVKFVLLSNAAGAVNADYEVGDIMIIRDHISFFTPNPLLGKNMEELGPRFPDMSEPYSKRLIQTAKAVGQKHGFDLKEGVYVGVTGPTFETRAEYRLIQVVGGDVVGMSTVQENIVAVHMGMEVFAASVVTDLGIREEENKITHEEVLEAAKAAEPKLATLFRELTGAI